MKITKKFLLLLLTYLLPLVLAGWGTLALKIDGPKTLALPIAWGVLSLGLIFGLRKRLVSLAVFGLCFAALLSWWFSLKPSNDRQWTADVTQLASSEIEGDKLKIKNVRNFEYRSNTDFTPRWEERTYDLSKLVGGDMFFSDWGAEGIVHTISSWEFSDGQHLAISIETRKEVGEEYSAVLGFFRQFEIYYVVADEQDVIGVRAKHRDEKVALYRLAMKPEQAKKILLAYLERINHLNTEPEWYNAFTANCTSTIRQHAAQVGLAKSLSWKHFANKHLPELFYERGLLNTRLPFAELRAKSDITEKVRSSKPDGSFSESIRWGLIERP